MALPFPNFPSWLWRNPASPPPSSSPDAAAPSLDLDSVAYQSRGNASFKRSETAHGRPASFQSVRRPHTGRRRWQKHRRQARSLDPDFDIVLVPSDGGCYLSGSDSDDSDWSVGWFEPHAPEFCSDGEAENSFAVLVPCYGSPSPDTLGGRGRFMAGQEENSKSQLWAAVLSNIAKDSQAESRQHLQQWLSSLQG